MTEHDSSKLSDRPRAEVVRAAGAWAELIAERDLTASERGLFEDWLQVAEHEMEFHVEFEIRFRLAQVQSDAFRSEASAPLPPPRYLPERRVWTRPRLAAAAIALLAIGATWLGLLREYAATGVYTTRIGECLSTTLADGTRIELNAQTDLEWLSTGACDRRIRLLRGEAWFNVHSDPRCPFQVLVGHGSIEVLGTEFDIHQGGNGEERVSVLEGRVRLHSPPGVSPWQVDLGAGQQATWSNTPPSTRQVDDPLKTIAWREDQLDLLDQPLAQVVEELQRYTAIPIHIADPRLLSVHVTGELKVDEAHIRASILRLGLRPEIEVKDDGHTLVLNYRPPKQQLDK